MAATARALLGICCASVVALHAGSSRAAGRSAANGNRISLDPASVSLVVSDCEAPRPTQKVKVRFEGAGVTVPLTVQPESLETEAIAGIGSMTEWKLEITGADIDWEAIASARWLALGAARGTGSASLRVDVDVTGLGPGKYAGTITIRDTLTKVARTVPVTLRVDPHQFQVDRGIGFFRIGHQARLSERLVVYDNASLSIPWKASSDQAWLRVDTPTGTTDGHHPSYLDVAADPTGLSPGMHFAHLTISPADVGRGTVATSVLVGLYVDPDRVTPVGRRAAAAAPLWVEVDPVRPFFYVTDGGEQIHVYDDKTGAPDGTITVPGARLIGGQITRDGMKLNVEDHANPGQFYLMDLDTRTAGEPHRIPCR